MEETVLEAGAEAPAVVVEEEAVVEEVQVFLNSMHLYFWELWPLLWLF